MTSLKWALLALGAAAVITYVAWWYRTREEPVKGRALAAVLRAGVLLLAWLILLNPSLPVSWGSAAGTEVVLLDASYSMSRPASVDGPAAWSLAADSVGDVEALWLFGGEPPRYVPIDSTPEEPIFPESRLAPALRSAALAGARSARVISDGRIVDAVEATEEARRQGFALVFTLIGAGYPEAGIADVIAPTWTQVGDSAKVRIDLVAGSLKGDSLRVEIVDEGGSVRAAAQVPAPDAGRHTPVRLALRVGRPPGYQRYVVRVVAPDPDPEPRDDRRAFYLHVTERPQGPVLISLVPDWEPSFLIPHLNRVTDAPTLAYLWLADSLVSLDGYRKVPLASVRRHAGAASLLVLHGYGPNSPPWARDLARRAPRLLILPAGTGAFELPGWDVRVGAPASGEWYASSELPASPLALALGGFAEDELAPLLRVRRVEADRSWHPLLLRRLRRGEPIPAVVLGSAGRRRWAVATAEGYWRWALRRGAGRQLYRGIWTGVTGWLLGDQATAGTGLEPLERVVGRGQPIRWIAPVEIDSLTVELSLADSGAVRRGSAAAGAVLPVLAPPGQYHYLAQAHESGRVVASSRGPVEVEEFSAELLPRSRSVPEGVAIEVEPRADQVSRPRRLATLGWPYLVLIVLFCAEWAVRRYIGLR